MAKLPPVSCHLSAGFTLLETLVAVAILALAVAGPLYSANRAVVAAQIANERLTASYLAQEGVEYIRAMRDHEYLSAFSFGGSTISLDAWNNFLNGGPSVVGSVLSCRNQTCLLDPSSPMGTGGSGHALQQCSGTGCTILYVRSGPSDEGLYTTSSGSANATPYTRTVEVDDISGVQTVSYGATSLPANVLVVSKVSWKDRGVSYTISITDVLAPWQ